MAKRINIGSEFISVGEPKEKPWIREVYSGPKNGTGSHSHFSLSGARFLSGCLVTEIWYARDINGNEIVKNGIPAVENVAQRMSDCMPNSLKDALISGNPLLLNLGSVDSIFKPKVNSINKKKEEDGQNN